VNSFWQFFWLLVWAFFFVCYLMVLFQIVADLFRDRSLSGGLKAVWIVLLLIFPLITSVVYLIARGRGMGERQVAAARDAKQATDAYIQSVAQTSPADQIATAKQLLDAGTISQAEFDTLKAKALA
jgi:predicted PurR-regulated permease PerM